MPPKVTPDPADRPSSLSLAELRKRLGRSQAEVASAIGTTQSGVSRIERQSDIRVSTLYQYVSALGAQLHFVVEHGAGHAELEVRALNHRDRDDERREYRVIWQDQTSRAFVHVGWLEFTGDEFVFSYTDHAKRHETFKPFPAFPIFDDTYRSKDLFPFFAVRLISTADPSFDVLVDALGLSRYEATPAELLALSPSESPHDTIQVVPEPRELADGTIVRTFLVSGISHIDEKDPDELSRVIAGLDVGTPLHLVPEPENPMNPGALQLAVENRAVGWVPDYLVDEIRSYQAAGRRLSFTVARANGPDVPWHLRLLCQLTVSADSSGPALEP